MEAFHPALRGARRPVPEMTARRWWEALEQDSDRAQARRARNLERARRVFNEHLHRCAWCREQVKHHGERAHLCERGGELGRVVLLRKAELSHGA